MYNVTKKRRQGLKDAKANPAPGSSAKDSYVKPDEDLSLKAADRLDTLRSTDKGPFAGGEKKAVAVSVGIHPAAGSEPKGGGTLPAIQPGLDSGAMADHHQKLADYFAKVAHPGSQTTPATTQLNPEEKMGLSDDVDMMK